ncbi:response regulator [Niabella pedocola]|uniref:Response regulator n=1 Tax=Niabella pedocola TaxID=1752077 RepID=A0ABS8PMB1_9BACT|nr:response regulator [Niabella pedocola]MCD2422161.1 response regulator [Niabella pedocola]
MKHKTILVFDDDVNILDIFKIVLEGSGYRVALSQTSDNIIEKTKEVNPDVIIMDNWIPGMGGLKATLLLKEHPDCKQIPVIYCSANREVRLLAEQANAQAFLAKPFDLEDLENMVAQLVQSNGPSI